ncbi:MAG: hypothetical protein EA426_02735 [Spirochaetaceae bacterium]|nr:MAG: hypothetical protein EA426_02735 [Spirochaetaceae bacterium]
MTERDISPRLSSIVDSLPLRPGMRVLEIGCGPGVVARAVVHRVAIVWSVLDCPDTGEQGGSGGCDQGRLDDG